MRVDLIHSAPEPASSTIESKIKLVQKISSKYPIGPVSRTSMLQTRLSRTTNFFSTQWIHFESSLPHSFFKEIFARLSLVLSFVLPLASSHLLEIVDRLLWKLNQHYWLAQWISYFELTFIFCSNCCWKLVLCWLGCAIFCMALGAGGGCVIVAWWNWTCWNCCCCCWELKVVNTCWPPCPEFWTTISLPLLIACGCCVTICIWGLRESCWICWDCGHALVFTTNCCICCCDCWLKIWGGGQLSMGGGWLRGMFVRILVAICCVFWLSFRSFPPSCLIAPSCLSSSGFIVINGL